MTRRRTSVFGAARSPQAEPAQAPPDAQLLRQWSAAAARKLVLCADGDPQKEQDELARVRRRWRICQGRETGNPEESSGRSDLRRLPPDAKSRVWWLKTFAQANGAWMENETAVLMRCLQADPDDKLGLRRHVGWLKVDGHSRLVEVSTLDAGPNLGMWRDFALCAGVGQHALKLPLFSQPVFLAAMVRQCLLALHALAPHQVVHADLKPGNLCLALPDAAGAWASNRADLQGQWNLRDLPLRLIDFEVGFTGQHTRRHHSGNNPNMSPYLRACHRAAAALPNAHDQAEVMSGIDWGTDAWAVGFMLAEWVAQAQAFNAAYLQAFGERWAIGSAAQQAADRALAPMWADLAWLGRFAQRLQAQERPDSDAQLRRLTPRDHQPLRSLWGELEDHFAALNPSASADTCRLYFSLINPEALLAEEADPHPWNLAAWRLRQRCAALVASAIPRLGGLARRRPGRLALIALLVAAPTLAWQARGDVQQAGLRLIDSWALVALQAFRNDGQAWQGWASAAGLAVASVLQPGRATFLTLATLTDTPSFDHRSPTLSAEALRSLRDTSLRGLVQLAALPHDILATDPAANRHGLRLLLAAYHAGYRLESAGPVPLGQGTGGASDALARVHRAQDYPLAALLQVHLLSCYGPFGRMAQAEPALVALRNTRIKAPSGSHYVGFATVVQARLAASKTACLLDPAVARPEPPRTPNATAPQPLPPQRSHP